MSGSDVQYLARFEDAGEVAAWSDADDPCFLSSPMKFPSIFSAEECRAIVAVAQRHAEVLAGLARPVQGYRTGVTRALVQDAETAWIYDKISGLFCAVNEWYRYEIRGMLDPLLYCEYPAGGHFHWHLDCGEPPTATRKISLSIQLSEDDEYTGGALEFAAQGALGGDRAIGTVIVFPAFLYHRVTPVTSGVRRSLVAWAHGPVFR